MNPLRFLRVVFNEEWAFPATLLLDKLAASRVGAWLTGGQRTRTRGVLPRETDTEKPRNVLLKLLVTATNSDYFAERHQKGKSSSSSSRRRRIIIPTDDEEENNAATKRRKIIVLKFTASK